jgi:hypothetical protein
MITTLTFRQEIYPSLCHTGKMPEEQETEFPGFDYSRCTPEVNVKKGIYAHKYASDSIKLLSSSSDYDRCRAGSIRANALLKMLKQRPEPVLVLITHYLTIIELIDNRYWKDESRINEVSCI